MKTAAYIVINRRGVVRLTKGRPGLRSGEFAVLLRMEVPDSLIAPDIPSVDLTVPIPDVIRPTITILPAASPAEASVESPNPSSPTEGTR